MVQLFILTCPAGSEKTNVYIILKFIYWYVAVGWFYQAK